MPMFERHGARGTDRIAFSPAVLIMAGWTGRARAAVEHHVADGRLQPRPARAPAEAAARAPARAGSRSRIHELDARCGAARPRS